MILDEKIDKVEKYSKIKGVSSSVASALQVKKTKLLKQIVVEEKAISKSLLDLADVVSKFGFIYKKSPTQGGLKFEKGFHQHGDVYWWDTNNNKIVFDVSVDDLLDSWNNICLYYVGGNNEDDFLKLFTPNRCHLTLPLGTLDGF